MAKHYKENNNKVFILSMLRIIFFVALVISIAYIVKWYFDGQQNKILEEQVSQAITVKR